MKITKYSLMILIISSIFSSKCLFSQSNFWEKTNFQGNGEICALIINSQGHIFAGETNWGSGSKNLYVSKDNGNSWSPTILTNKHIECLLIKSNGHIFAGTTGDYIYRSTDNGETWQQRTNGLTDNDPRCFSINSTGVIFTGTWGGGIYRSSNDGDTWEGISSGLKNRVVWALAFNSNDHIFAGTNMGIHKSIDNGDSWTQLTNEMTETSVYRLIIDKNDYIYAGTYYGVYRSTDNGETWEKKNKGLAYTNVEAFALNSDGNIFLGVTPGLNADGSVYRSTDQGENWVEIKSGLTNTKISSFAIDADDIIFVGTNGGGIFKSIESTTSVTQENKSALEKFSLNQNYPNPFNSTTTIQYNLINNVNVKINIYNILGTFLKTLINTQQNAGTYLINWDGKDENGRTMTSGIYICKIQAAEYSKTIQMLLLN